VADDAPAETRMSQLGQRPKNVWTVRRHLLTCNYQLLKR